MSNLNFNPTSSNNNQAHFPVNVEEPAQLGAVARQNIQKQSNYYLNATGRPSQSWRPLSFSLNGLINAYLIDGKNDSFMTSVCKVILWIASALTLFIPTLLAAILLRTIDLSGCDGDLSDLREKYNQLDGLEKEYRDYLEGIGDQPNSPEAQKFRTKFLEQANRENPTLTAQLTENEIDKAIFTRLCIEKDIIATRVQGKKDTLTFLAQDQGGSVSPIDVDYSIIDILEISKIRKNLGSLSENEFKALLKNPQFHDYGDIPDSHLNYIDYKTLDKSQIHNLLKDKSKTSHKLKMLSEQNFKDLFNNKCEEAFARNSFSNGHFTQTESIASRYLLEHAPDCHLNHIDYASMTTEEYHSFFYLRDLHDGNKLAAFLGKLNDNSLKGFLGHPRSAREIILEKVPQKYINFLNFNEIIKINDLIYSYENSAANDQETLINFLRDLTEDNKRLFLNHENLSEYYFRYIPQEYVKHIDLAHGEAGKLIRLFGKNSLAKISLLTSGQLADLKKNPNIRFTTN